MNSTLGPTPDQLARMRANVMTRIAMPKRPPRRIGLIASAIAVTALATTGGAIAIAMASPDQANTSFDCYTVADVGADHTTVMPVDDGRDTDTLLSLGARVKAALDACETSWSAAPDDPYPGGGPFEVSNPTACVLRDHRIAVFPNDDNKDDSDFCAALGLADPQP